MRVMIPARLLRPAKLNEVVPPAIMLGVGKFGITFFVAGQGAEAFVCALSEQHRFEAFALAKGQHYDGLAVEGVEIEIDFDSRYDPIGSSAIAGSLVRQGPHLRMGVFAAGGFRRVTEALVASDFPEGSEGQVIGFTRWRAVVRDGDRIIEICEVDVTPQADDAETA